MIQLDKITVTKSGKQLIKPLSLALEPGQFVAIIGPNGAGKTSLLKTLAGERVTTGGINFNRADLRDLSHNQLARQRAVLPQHDGLNAPLTVLEVLELGLLPFKSVLTKSALQTSLDKAVAAGQLAEFARRNYLSLSGGERARVRFGRLCAQLHAARQDPEYGAGSHYALLDEPLAALDLRYQRLLMDAMRDLVDSNTGVIAVIHDLNWLVGHVDRVCVMVNGCLVADDAPEAVLHSPQLSHWFSTTLSVSSYQQASSGSDSSEQNLRVAVHA